MPLLSFLARRAYLSVKYKCLSMPLESFKDQDCQQDEGHRTRILLRLEAWATIYQNKRLSAVPRGVKQPCAKLAGKRTCAIRAQATTEGHGSQLKLVHGFIANY
jgi:hypothetical protein